MPNSDSAIATPVCQWRLPPNFSQGLPRLTAQGDTLTRIRKIHTGIGDSVVVREGRRM